MDCAIDKFIKQENEIKIEALVNLEYVKTEYEHNQLSLDKKFKEDEYNHNDFSESKVIVDEPIVMIVDIKKEALDVTIKEDDTFSKGLENAVIKEEREQENKITIKTSVNLEYVKREYRHNQLSLDKKVKDDGYNINDFSENKVIVDETVVMIMDIKEEATDKTIKDDKGLENKVIKKEIDVELENEEEPAEIKIPIDINSPDYMSVDDNHFYCNKCGEKYEDYCFKCLTLTHILNNSISSTISDCQLKTLPADILEIKQTFIGNGVFALKTLPKNIIFGPFEGVSRIESTKGYLWEIKNGKLVTVKNCNWMEYVSCTPSTVLQNLNVFQFEGNLFYQTNRKINKNEELTVYYNDEEIQKCDNDEKGYYSPVIEENCQKLFACTHCCLGFSLEETLTEHKINCPYAMNNTIDELIQCQYCNIWLEKQEYLINHKDYCQDHYPRICNFPMASDRSKINVAIEIQGKTDEDCTSVVEQSHTLNSNNVSVIGTKQQRSIGIKKDYKCPLCSYKINRRDKLQLHIKNKHLFGTEKDFKCPHCSFGTNFKDYLKLHIKNSHSDGIGKDFKCTQCSYQTIFKRDLLLHINTKHPVVVKKKLKCALCPYEINRKDKLQLHIRDKHSVGLEKDFKCARCTYETNRKNNLKSHIKNKHSDGAEKDFKCVLCSYETNYKDSMRLHISSKHSAGVAKDFKCELCSYETNRKIKLQFHIKNKHLVRTEKDFKCDVCSFQTNYKDKLRLHTKNKHSDETGKDFKCTNCPYQTNIKTNLQKHINRKHSVEVENDYKSASSKELSNTVC